MATYGYIENLSGARLVITSLGMSLPTGFTEEIDDTDVRTEYGQQQWRNAATELAALVTSGDIEIRESDDTTIVSAANVQSWIDLEFATLSSLPTDIGNTKLDVTNNGTAVIIKAIAGTGILLGSTGPDAGTGEVTINATGGSGVTYLNFISALNGKWKKNGLTWLTQDKIPHNDAGFYLVKDGTLKYMWVTVDRVDTNEDWNIILYKNPTSSSRVSVASQTMTSGQRTYLFGPLSVALTAGEYGLAGEQDTSGNKHSKFKDVVAGIVVEVST